MHCGAASQSVAARRLRDDTRAIVLDANILIRAVLGVKVSALIADHAAGVNFLAPDTAFQEVQEHLPAILSSRGAAAEDLAAAPRCSWA